ncbi:uncharacterized protein LOC134233903 [Saccostrea cucullata]|uniref:uncharacterized protein LOC134233903 n=1 Tax=Saccostrea cuccullata TaxID=36930 RepID=UPI002ED32CD6
MVIVVPLCVCYWKKRRKKLEQSQGIELEKIPVEKPAVSCPDINNITNDKEAVKMSEKEPLLHVTVNDETVNSEEVDSNDIFVGPDGVIKQLTEEIPNSSDQKTALSVEGLDSEAVTGQVIIQREEPSQQSDVQSIPSHDSANLNTAVKTQNFTVCKDESPEVKKITVEKQKSDPTNIIQTAEPCSNPIHIVQMEDPPVIFLAPDSSPLVFSSNPQPPLTLPSDPQPPHSIGSLRSDEKYSHLSLSSLGEHVVPPDSDYGTGSSTKNNSATLVSLGSSGNYTDLHWSSLQSNEGNLRPGQPNKTVVPPQQESQQNINNPKVVAIVSPFRRDEKGTLKIVDEEQTYSKTP